MAVLPINLNPLLKTYQNTALPLAAVSCGDHEEKKENIFNYGMHTINIIKNSF